MAKSLKYHKQWLPLHGVKVKYQGLTYRIDVSTWTASYPYREEKISVYATPVSKNSKYYRETKKALGDDWSTCLLDSDVEVESEFFRLAKEAQAIT